MSPEDQFAPVSCRGRFAPRIDDRSARPFIVARVARDDREAMLERGRGNDEIGLREGMARLAAVLDQDPPFEHDVLADGKDALFEHRPHLVREPIVQFGAAGCVADEFDAEADFGEGNRADVEQIERLRRDEGDDFGFRLGAAQFGENIRVEQPSRHRSTPRTGKRSRLGSSPISR